MFSLGVQFWRAGRQEDQRDVVGLSSLAVVCDRPGAVEQRHGWAPSATWAGDFLKMELHGLGVGERQRKRGPDASGGTSGAEEVAAFVALIAGIAGPRSAFGPLMTLEAVLLSDARFVLT
jgi:hypothetical protein